MVYRQSKSIFKRWLKGHFSLLFCLCILFAALQPAAQNSNQNLEYAVKSTLIVKLPKYMEWPNEADSKEDFIITVLGKNPFGKMLDEQAKKLKYRGRDIVIRYIDRVSELGKTNVLFINRNLRSQWPEIQEAIKEKHVLTVSEFDSFAQSGGIINFFIDDGTVNMEVNVKAAERNQIKINSLVLQLRKVKVVRE